MADPITATLVAGTSLLSASAAVQQGAAARAAGQFNANMAERNAQVAEQQAEQIKRSSEFDINRFRDNFADLQATAAQAFRYNGFVATGGTPLQVLWITLERPILRLHCVVTMHLLVSNRR